MRSVVPDCPFNRTDCEFEEGPAYVTTVNYTPRYDRDGVNLNPDRNTRSWRVKCVKCASGWDCAQVGSDAPAVKRWNEASEKK